MTTVIKDNDLKSQKFDSLFNHKDYAAYHNFMLSLRTESTQKIYSFYLFKFLSYNRNYGNLSLDQILSINPKELEASIISTIVKMKKEDNLSTASTSQLLASLNHFFAINDVLLNRKKISKFIGEHENKYEYRSYTREEISRLLSLLDERGKAAVLVMASSGMRVGGLVEIRLKHLQKKIIGETGSRYLYKIIVYGSSSKHRYITFCSPEAAKAIDEYLEMRRRYGENLVQDGETGRWSPGETPLIIRQFDKDARVHKILPLTPTAVSAKIIVPKLRQLGIRGKNNVLDSAGIKRAPGLYRYELHPCHSLRIFAVTQMQGARIDKTIREMLVGHSTGLDSVYYKPHEEQLLEEYSKSIDYLTINNEHRLQKQLDHYRSKSEEIQDIRQQLDKNYEAKIESIKTEMENKFKQLFEKINPTKLQ
ncbi:MAG: tyrosine-type recombinase/integrase [Candidatus Nitrosocosmicus sp.]